MLSYVMRTMKLFVFCLGRTLYTLLFVWWFLVVPFEKSTQPLPDILRHIGPIEMPKLSCLLYTIIIMGTTSQLLLMNTLQLFLYTILCTYMYVMEITWTYLDCWASTA